MQMCKSCMHIIIAQIVIHNEKVQSITIYKYEIDLKLCALTFKVGKYITRAFLNVDASMLRGVICTHLGDIFPKYY